MQHAASDDVLGMARDPAAWDGLRPERIDIRAEGHP